MADHDDLVISPLLRNTDARRVTLDEALASHSVPQHNIAQDFENVLDTQIQSQKKHDSHAIKTVCVYCGSSPGANPVYIETAKKLGAKLADAGIDLVYGGGGIGIMGAVARAVLQGGGKVTGIIPDFLLLKEGDFRDVTEQHVVPDMHKRKMMMFDRADAFIAFPGGVGTLEEVIEMMTWAQLGRHGKPIIFGNINNFWKPLLSLLDHMRHEGFIRPDMPVAYQVCDTVDDIMRKITSDHAAAPKPKAEADIQKRF